MFSEFFIRVKLKRTILFNKYSLYCLFFLILGCNKNIEFEEFSEYKIILVSGDNQIGIQNTALDDNIIIKVVDNLGAIVSGVNLNIEIISGGGEIISGTSIKSNDEGNASILWKLGLDYNNSLEVYPVANNSSSVLVNATARYKYKLPDKINDGWEPNEIDNVLSSVDKIYDGIDEIRNGNYENIHSVLLSVNNNLVLEEYFSGTNSFGEFINYDRNTLHELQSVNKSFRGAMIGIAIDKGYIDSEKVPIHNFFPELDYLSKDGKESILLEHFLGMTSGLEWNESKDLADFYGNPFDKAHTYVLSKPLESTPGTVFEYNTGASFVLNKIIINSINTGYQEFAQNNYSVLIESNALPGTGNPLDFRNTPRDMLKLGQVYLNDGKWKNTQVISKAWIDKSTQVHINVSATNSYGYQWWIREFNIASNTYNCFYAAGFGGQYIFVIKELNLVAVFTGGNFNSNSPAIEIMEDYILPAFE